VLARPEAESRLLLPRFAPRVVTQIFSPRMRRLMPLAIFLARQLYAMACRVRHAAYANGAAFSAILRHAVI